MVAAVFADDGIQLSANGKIIRGRKAIMERQKVAMAGVEPGVKVTVTTARVWLDGDLAYESGKYKYEYIQQGKPGVDEGRYVTIWNARGTAHGNSRWIWAYRTIDRQASRQTKFTRQSTEVSS